MFSRFFAKQNEQLQRAARFHINQLTFYQTAIDEYKTSGRRKFE